MEWLNADFMGKLLSIIFIDLILSGDNAIVIALSARNLPKHQQKKVIWIGTGGAVLIRGIATLIVAWLLNIPGLLLIGGLVLVWIAYKLLVDQKGQENIKEAATMWGAIRTILIADAAMGLDNMLAIAGVAEGHYGLIIIGFAVSVPIMIWGSTLFIRLIDRFPFIIYAGSGVLAYTAAKMILNEPMIQSNLEGADGLKWTAIVSIVLIVLVLGKWDNVRKQRRGKMKPQTERN